MKYVQMTYIVADRQSCGIMHIASNIIMYTYGIAMSVHIVHV